MDVGQIKRVYFIGIGGIGMSALARYFLHLGKTVAGYDRVETPLTTELSELGIDIHYQDNPKLIPSEFSEVNGSLIVYTPAVPAELSELQFLKAGGYPIYKRSEVLGWITRDTFCFAVAGTHGKTTTSSILAHLLKESGTPVTAFLGGISEDFGSNFYFQGSSYSVVEADEYDRSFLRLHPDVACITSMDADHLDIYQNPESLREAFIQFSQQIKPGGKLFVRNGLPLHGITYGIEDDSDFCIRNIRIVDGSYVFDLKTPAASHTEVRFSKPGRHNLLNGLAAFAMALQAGTNAESLIAGLASFRGVSRRFSYLIKKEGLVFIDDYAHHPAEIDAVYEAVSEMHPGKKTLAVFQPHLYSRTRDFAAAFAKSLSRFDTVILLDIYPARELPIAGIDSAWLLGQIDNPDKKVIKKMSLIPEIQSQNPEVLITMGAGDIGLEVGRIKKALEHGN